MSTALRQPGNAEEPGEDRFPARARDGVRRRPGAGQGVGHRLQKHHPEVRIRGRGTGGCIHFSKEAYYDMGSIFFSPFLSE